LLRYNQNHFNVVDAPLSSYPLADEPFVAVWLQYAREAEATGSIACVAQYLPQLQFPIQAGISRDPGYLAAVRRGTDPSASGISVGIQLRDPEQGRIVIHPTPAGRIPLLIAGSRADFVTLVQALTMRNEPTPIPDSMGACMIAGYNNWHRIAMLRREFDDSSSALGSWADEFQRIKAQRELYQDRFIILSDGPYSGVDASDIGLDEQEWKELSLVIRREHECAHYYARRIFSSMRNNLLDELIADYFGISAATGRFRAQWLLRFWGLENFPRYRPGGRMENYRGDPPLSEKAFEVLQRMIRSAAANLASFDEQHVPKFQQLRLQPALYLTLTRLTIEQISAPNGTETLATGFASDMRKVFGAGNLNIKGAISCGDGEFFQKSITDNAKIRPVPERGGA